ncbi:MAG: TolC family protein [Phycisphaeraceae bacterium]|nr:TolC family protein [Phycisphaeraceae bacterium]
MRSPIILGLSLAAVGLLSGCVSYSPRPLDPRAELAALNSHTIPAATKVEMGASEAADGSDVFDPTDGLSDRELMAVAVVLSPDLRAARAGIGESEALLIKAKTLPNPEIGVGFGLGIVGTNGFKLDTDLLFELLKPGERSARQAVAASRIELSRAEVLAKEYSLAADVRRLAFDVLVAEQAVAILDSEVALRQQASDLLRQRRVVGEANDLDVSAVDLELVEVQRDRRLGLAELEQARIALNRAMGLPPPTTVRLEASGKPLEIPLVELPDDDTLGERLLTSRLDLKAREAQYQVAEDELMLAVSRQYAKLKAGPLYSHEGASDNYAGVSASIEVPIFDRNQGEIAERTAARDHVRAEYVAELHRLRSEAASTLARVRASKAEIDIQDREVIPLLERNQTLFRSAFQARELNVLDWVTAQQRSLRTRRAYLDTLTAYRRALLDLEALSGFPVWRLIAKEPESESPTPLHNGSNP